MMNPMQIMGQVKQFRENMLRQNPGCGCGGFNG